MGKMKQKQEMAHKEHTVKESFVDFLAKTGNRAANEYKHGWLGGLTENHIIDAMRYATASFGKPDTLIVSPQALDAFKKLQK